MVGGAALEGTFPRSSVGAISRQRARGAFWYGALLFWFVGHVKSVSVVRSAVPVQSCPKKQPVTPLSFRRAQRGEISQWHPLTRSLPAVETTGGEQLLMVGGSALEGTFPRSSVGAISRQRARGAFWYGALLFWFVGHVKSVSVVRSAVPVQSCPKKTASYPFVVSTSAARRNLAMASSYEISPCGRDDRRGVVAYGWRLCPRRNVPALQRGSDQPPAGAGGVLVWGVAFLVCWAR
jgi:hypothetical protein